MLGFYDARRETAYSDGDPLTSFTDLSDNGWNLTQADSAEQPTWQEPGTYPGIDQAHVLFDGSDHLVSTEAIEPGTGEFSVHLWFKPSEDATYQGLIGKGNDGSSNEIGWSVQLSGSNTIVVRCNDGSEKAGKTWTFGSDYLDEGEWMLLSIVFDRSGGNTELVCYINGQTTGWVDGGGGAAGATLTSDSNDITTADPFTLGAFSNTNNDLVTGSQVGALAIYSAAHTADQVRSFHGYFSNRSFDKVEGTTLVFEGGVDSSDYYRIPALVHYKDASNELLMCVCENRETASDNGDIHLVAKTSTDNGANWSSEATVADNGTDEAHNPCLVADPANDAIHLLFAKRNDTEANIIAGVATMQIYHRKYTVSTATWGDETDITSDAAPDGVRWRVPSPGHGIVLPSGRILVPANNIDASSVNKAHVFWSDDGGDTWECSAVIGQSGANESTICQLTDGTILMASRNQSGANRLFQTSTDDGETWSSSSEDSFLAAFATQASLVTVGTRMYFSAPTSSGSPRDEFAIYSALANTNRTWDRFAFLDRTLAAYSCMAPLSDGRIAIAYEPDTSANDIRFQILSTIK